MSKKVAALKRKQANIRRREKQVRTAAAMLREAGEALDHEAQAKAIHDSYLKGCTDGYRQAVGDIAENLNDCKSIVQVRKVMSEYVQADS